MKSNNSRNWDGLYEEYLNTGMSVTAFAKSKNIPVSSMSPQFRKRKEQSDTASACSFQDFIPLIVSDDTTFKNSATTPDEQKQGIILSAGKFTITIGGGLDEDVLYKVLKAVDRLC